MPRGGMVTLAPSRGSKLTLIVTGAPDRGGGVGGWESSERPARAPAKWWKSQPEDTMSLPLMLDLHAIGGPSLERRLDVLYAMGRPRDDDEPPTITITGDIAARDKTRPWVMQNITLGDRLWTPTGELRRQQLTVELAGYQPLESITPVRPGRTRARLASKRRRREIRSQTGDTLRAIAVRQLGNAGGWREIRQWNPKLRKIDPDERLATGTRVVLR